MLGLSLQWQFLRVDTGWSSELLAELFLSGMSDFTFWSKLGNTRTTVQSIGYISVRHMDGDMYPPSREQYRSFLFSQWSDTFFLSAYKQNELMAVAVTDRQQSGVSAMYTFFNPYEAKRSLGVYSILQQLEYCKATELEYLYLGYWIKNSKKMAYKDQYRPIQVYSNDTWRTLD